MKLKLLVACAMVLGSFTVTAPQSADARSLGRSPIPACKNGLTGRAGIAVKKRKAEDRGLRKWQYDSQRKYGKKFIIPARDSQHFHCKKKAGTWRCSLVAYPCPK